MKYVMAIFLLTGIMAAQTRAQLKADNQLLWDTAMNLSKELERTKVELAEANAQIDQLKTVQKIFIDFINEELSKPAPVPQVVTRTVVAPPMIIETPAQPSYCTGYAHTSGDGVTIAKSSCW